jgi:hypothetical protein
MAFCVKKRIWFISLRTLAKEKSPANGVNPYFPVGKKPKPRVLLSSCRQRDRSTASISCQRWNNFSLSHLVAL